MKENETWFEFMDRTKKNGISPTTQEEIDKDNTIKMKTITDYYKVVIVNKKIQTALDINEYSEIPCVHIKTNEEILGNRALKEITYIAPKPLECN